MRYKKFKKFLITWGTVSGFSIGFSVSRYFATIDLGFWFIGLEY